jgi:hypothetical protein
VLHSDLYPADFGVEGTLIIDTAKYSNNRVSQAKMDNECQCSLKLVRPRSGRPKPMMLRRLAVLVPFSIPVSPVLSTRIVALVKLVCKSRVQVQSFRRPISKFTRAWGHGKSRAPASSIALTYLRTYVLLCRGMQQSYTTDDHLACRVHHKTKDTNP